MRSVRSENEEHCQTPHTMAGGGCPFTFRIALMIISASSVLPCSASGSGSKNNLRGEAARPRPSSRRAAPHVRANRARIENEGLFHPARSAWGGRDPSAPPVTYGPHHPFEMAERARLLATVNVTVPVAAGDGRSLQNSGGVSRFRPVRILFYLEQLKRDSRNSADPDAVFKARFIEDYILKRMEKFWRDALSVVPVEGSLVLDPSSLYAGAYCGDTQFTRVPEDHMTDGVTNTDLILYVSGSESELFCGENTLAVAVACNMDQWDRPIAGAINFCFSGIEVKGDGKGGMSLPSQEIIDDNVDVAIHEAAHVLGMSSNSFRFFRDKKTGNPLTDRPIRATTVKCVDDIERTVHLPSERVLKFNTNPNTGKKTAVIVTDLVATVARNQFNCQELDGAHLENQPTGSGSCTGDHWDERQFYPEALSGVISPTENILSPLTLALFEDSGWYQANYSIADVSPWGHGAGCDFVNKDCLDRAGNIPDYGRSYFCNKQNEKSCSPGNTHKMQCTLIDYAERQFLIPRKFQYFPSDTAMGGPVQIDFCPVYSTSYGLSIIDGGSTAGDLDCRDERNGVGAISNAFFEEYGKSSRCFETDNGEGKCYPRVCLKDEHVVRIFVRNKWHTCNYDFEEITPYEVNVNIAIFTDFLNFKIICPRLSSVCPDLFCPANCSGRGTCRWTKNATHPTAPPKSQCICFDETDKSPGCSSTLQLHGDWVDNADSVGGKVRKAGFFDNFVKLFVDDPDDWSNTTKAWGAGFATIVAILFLCLCQSLFPTRKAKTRGGKKRKTKSSNKSKGRKRSQSPTKKGRGKSRGKSRDSRDTRDRRKRRR